MIFNIALKGGACIFHLCANLNFFDARVFERFIISCVGALWRIILHLRMKMSPVCYRFNRKEKTYEVFLSLIG